MGPGQQKSVARGGSLKVIPNPDFCLALSACLQVYVTGIVLVPYLWQSHAGGHAFLTGQTKIISFSSLKCFCLAFCHRNGKVTNAMFIIIKNFP